MCGVANFAHRWETHKKISLVIAMQKLPRSFTLVLFSGLSFAFATSCFASEREWVRVVTAGDSSYHIENRIFRTGDGLFRFFSYREVFSQPKKENGIEVYGVENFISVDCSARNWRRQVSWQLREDGRPIGISLRPGELQRTENWNPERKIIDFACSR